MSEAESKSPGPETPAQNTSPEAPRSRMALLCLTALGVVYGDIGTSPLYALRECFNGVHGIPASQANVYGVLSLIFWSLVIVVSIKYLLYILRADNRGEGGILALMSLLRHEDREKKRYKVVAFLGLFGAALIYGDGVITPAISVLSAIEGLEVETPLFKPYILPITTVVLLCLFFFQKKGTTRVGMVFGPIMMVWFLTLGALGLYGIARHPTILAAISPEYAVRFFLENGKIGYLVLGAVFLVLTGSEALYADLGHFSRKPIQLNWFCFVGPCLVLNYFGQGALLLDDPSASVNPFFHLPPAWALFPLVVLSTVATSIASQAIITGAFSLTRQAIHMGYAPRMKMVHTSANEIGQIYIPFVNWALALVTIALVIGFKSSSNLAAAYGIAVAFEMVFTTTLAFFVARYRWGWSLPAALATTLLFLAVDLAFLGANLLKVMQGGWFPIVIALLILFVFLTWRKGNLLLNEKLKKEALPLPLFIADAQQTAMTRVTGNAVFLNGNPNGTPSALLHNIKHNKILHQRNFFVTVLNEDIPYAAAKERLSVEDMGGEFHRVFLRVGFMEFPDVLSALYGAKARGVAIDPLMATYLISRNTLVPATASGMSSWRMSLFRFLHHNALQPASFFGLPPNRVVELGRQIEV
ncbi:MAG TPA: potassium transporter Kup [Elusimicrobia bacterium]|nr:potassium transporter Kup [Elusimicrobiota bacterium]